MTPDWLNDGLDEKIDHALGSEGLRTPPPGLHARVRDRVEVTSLFQREKRRFRRAALAAAAICLAVTIGMPWLILSSDLLQKLVRTAPGVLGVADSVLAARLIPAEGLFLWSGAIAAVALAAVSVLKRPAAKSAPRSLRS